MGHARCAVSTFLLCWAAQGQTIPLDEAASAFATARKISSEEGGRTWGIEVCGPMMFADSATNDVVANQADAKGELKLAGGVWQGGLPKPVHVANTALEWNGVRWTMVMWPLPEDTRERAQLLAHECYHRIQPALKLPATDAMHPAPLMACCWMNPVWIGARG